MSGGGARGRVGVGRGAGGAGRGGGGAGPVSGAPRCGRCPTPRGWRGSPTGRSWAAAASPPRGLWREGGGARGRVRRGAGRVVPGAGGGGAAAPAAGPPRRPSRHD